MKRGALEFAEKDDKKHNGESDIGTRKRLMDNFPINQRTGLILKGRKVLNILKMGHDSLLCIGIGI